MCWNGPLGEPGEGADEITILRSINEKLFKLTEKNMLDKTYLDIYGVPCRPIGCTGGESPDAWEPIGGSGIIGETNNPGPMGAYAVPVKRDADDIVNEIKTKLQELEALKSSSAICDYCKSPKLLVVNGWFTFQDKYYKTDKDRLRVRIEFPHVNICTDCLKRILRNSNVHMDLED